MGIYAKEIKKTAKRDDSESDVSQEEFRKMTLAHLPSLSRGWKSNATIFGLHPSLQNQKQREQSENRDDGADQPPLSSVNHKRWFSPAKDSFMEDEDVSLDEKLASADASHAKKTAREMMFSTP